MIDAPPLFAYRAYGMPVLSTFPLNGLVPADPRSCVDPVSIQLGDVPAGLDRPLIEDSVRQITNAAYLRHFPGLLRLYVEDGRRVILNPVPDCPRTALEAIALGAGLGVAGFQRGYLPLHASVVEVNGTGVAFTGPSGAGKSTTAAHLGQRGFANVADDLCMVRLEAEEARVGRGVSHLRLWDDAVAVLGWKDAPRSPLPEGEGAKAVYAVATPPQVADFTLRRLYLLRAADESSPPGLARLEAGAALAALLESLRLPPIALTTGQAAAHFRRLVALCNTIDVYTFTRPWDLGQLPRWLDRLTAHLQEG